MYLRETRRRNKDGTTLSYLQLAHNERHPVSRVSSTKVIHSFGRDDQVDREALARLVRSISRLLDPADQARAQASGEVSVLDSRPLGGARVLDQLWPPARHQPGDRHGGALAGRSSRPRSG